MKYLIVGLGSMGKRRIRNLIALGVDTKDIFACDLIESRRLEATETYGIETLSDLPEAFRREPGAVIVSTPPDTHMRFAKMAAEKGIHFFTEAGTSLDGMQEVTSLANSNKIIAAPSCTLRFHPLISKMREQISAGAIGKVLAFTHHCGQYLPDWHPWEDYRKFYVSKRETGACREIVPFELNWLIWVLGWPIGITAFKTKVSSLDCDIDDIYQVLLKFEDQVLGHLQVDVIARAPTRSFRVLGSEGSMEWNAVEKSLRLFNAKLGTWDTILENQLTIASGYSEMSPEQMYISEIKAFIEAIQGVKKFPHTMEEDMRILKILLSIEESSEQGLHVENV